MSSDKPALSQKTKDRHPEYHGSCVVKVDGPAYTVYGVTEQQFMDVIWPYVAERAQPGVAVTRLSTGGLQLFVGPKTGSELCQCLDGNGWFVDYLNIGKEAVHAREVIKVDDYGEIVIVLLHFLERYPNQRILIMAPDEPNARNLRGIISGFTGQDPLKHILHDLNHDGHLATGERHYLTHWHEYAQSRHPTFDMVLIVGINSLLGDQGEQYFGDERLFQRFARHTLICTSSSSDTVVNEHVQAEALHRLRGRTYVSPHMPFSKVIFVSTPDREDASGVVLKPDATRRHNKVVAEVADAIARYDPVILDRYGLLADTSHRRVGILVDDSHQAEEIESMLFDWTVADGTEFTGLGDRGIFTSAILSERRPDVDVVVNATHGPTPLNCSARRPGDLPPTVWIDFWQGPWQVPTPDVVGRINSYRASNLSVEFRLWSPEGYRLKPQSRLRNPCCWYT